MLINIDLSILFILIPIWFIIVSAGIVLPMKSKLKYLVMSICMLSIFCCTEMCLTDFIIYRRVIDNRNIIKQDIVEIKRHEYESHREKVFIYNYLRTTYGDVTYIYTGSTVKVFNLEIGGL